MKVLEQEIVQKTKFGNILSNIFKKKVQLEKKNNQNNKIIVAKEDKCQDKTPKNHYVGRELSIEEQKIIKNFKNKIISLNIQGYSIRHITSYINEIFSNGDYDIISRETVRKIINGEQVSLKTLVKILKFQKDLL